MLKNHISRMALGMGAAIMISGVASAHPAHSVDAKSGAGASESGLLLALQEAGGPDRSLVSGQGDLKFRVLHTSDALPRRAMRGLTAAHGGFAVDRREEKGEVYFALPNVGILRISADLNTIELLATDETMVKTNMHNTTVWYGKRNKAYLTFPGNNSNKVDRKSTRLNSSHVVISYAVFCLKKKN